MNRRTLKSRRSQARGACRPRLFRNDRLGGWVDPKVTALVSVAARAPDASGGQFGAGEDVSYTPSHSRHCLDDDWGQLSEEAFLHDFAGDLPPAEARTFTTRGGATRYP
jgi:hypothetical protein